MIDVIGIKVKLICTALCDPAKTPSCITTNRRECCKPFRVYNTEQPKINRGIKCWYNPKCLNASTELHVESQHEVCDGRRWGPLALQFKQVRYYALCLQTLQCVKRFDQILLFFYLFTVLILNRNSQRAVIPFLLTHVNVWTNVGQCRFVSLTLQQPSVTRVFNAFVSVTYELPWYANVK